MAAAVSVGFSQWIERAAPAIVTTRQSAIGACSATTASGRASASSSTWQWPAPGNGSRSCRSAHSGRQRRHPLARSRPVSPEHISSTGIRSRRDARLVGKERVRSIENWYRMRTSPGTMENRLAPYRGTTPCSPPRIRISIVTKRLTLSERFLSISPIAPPRKCLTTSTAPSPKMVEQRGTIVDHLGDFDRSVDLLPAPAPVVDQDHLPPAQRRQQRHPQAHPHPACRPGDQQHPVCPFRRSRSERWRDHARTGASPDFPECIQMAILSVMAQDA